MTGQTTQGGLYGPQSAPDDSTDAGAATEAGDGRVAARDGLREQYAAVIRAFEPGRSAAQCQETADAVLAVRDRELERLRAELERLREQQAGFFAQMAAARQQGRRWWQRAQAAERALEGQQQETAQ